MTVLGIFLCEAVLVYKHWDYYYSFNFQPLSSLIIGYLSTDLIHDIWSDQWQPGCVLCCFTSFHCSVLSCPWRCVIKVYCGEFNKMSKWYIIITEYTSGTIKTGKNSKYKVGSRNRDVLLKTNKKEKMTEGLREAHFNHSVVVGYSVGGLESPLDRPA